MEIRNSVTPPPAMFEPFDEAWQRFTTQYPMLGLSGTRWAGVHVKRVYGAALISSGASVRTVSGKWLAHRERFPDCMFALLVNGKLPEVRHETPPPATVASQGLAAGRGADEQPA